MQDYLRAKSDVKLRGNLIKHHNSQKRDLKSRELEKKSDLNRCLHALLNRNVVHFFSELKQKLAQKVN